MRSVESAAPRRVVHLADARGFRVVEWWHPPKLQVPWHVNDRPALTCVLGGGFEESLQSGSIECSARTVLFKPPGERHSNRSGPAGAHCIAFELPEQRLPEMGSARRVGSVQTEALVALVRSELRAPDACVAIAVEGLVLELLAAVGRTATTPTLPGRPAWLDGVLEELRSRFRDPLPVHEVAAFAGVTPSYFARVLLQHEGQTPTAYLRRLRIEWAKVQLLRTDRSLASIAIEAGFADQSHFTRTFARLEGTTPGRFRQRRPGDERC